ncbi:glucose-6-phosphate dehydrogenase assembly protein OpcA [Corynebacterium incognita]|uniref:Glucose-6-phosphate dehydrogenase assembly protein OpcA n=1 Tax=Corynebacterium incognita TaxID=2754725 RepID=A0A7G7CPT7_9CORY|nr:glucose-6-phosphate dehydrogenase assembly protein OpcA [Corynebacterium incognita]QNE89603.1 glucose-6-phosphate dehydrogenase assembly protein OpcA [Corynebacterium incognita]
MIIDLPQTSTRELGKKLVEAQEHYTLTTGRVLTLITMAYATDDLDALLTAVRDASHEHPSRVIVIVDDKEAAAGEENSLDAQLRVGGEAGASEIVVMHLHGDLAHHADSVVTPLLLPDTPIVAWWPTDCPERPSEHPIGALAQRRITNVAHRHRGRDLDSLSAGYLPGDSDMMWAFITPWRGVVASALDRHPHEPVESVTIEGPKQSSAVDIAAGWLADRLGVPVRRTYSTDDNPDWFPIRHLALHRATCPVTIDVVDQFTLKITVPGTPESLVALSSRSTAETISEELRHLDADATYAHALRALSQITYD